MWHGCYDDSWKDFIVPEAFCHPAKIARGLSARIYQHATEQGWLKRGDTGLDCFGGIGGTALWPAVHGVQWIGCELEPRFHTLALENFALWKRRWGHTPDWCEPVMVCGDSRRLGELMAGKVKMCCASPPFQGSINDGADHERMRDKYPGWGLNPDGSNRMAKSVGLGAMKEGQLDLAVSSLPYAESLSGKQETVEEVRNSMSRRGCKASSIKKASGHTGSLGYGTTPGNIANLPEGMQIVVSSPPYEAVQVCTEQGQSTSYDRTGERCGKDLSAQGKHTKDYGNSDGQLGNQQGDTFWSASRIIVSEVVKLLRSGGHACWVVKAFVRKCKLVDFPGQWEVLCNSLGLRTVCRHHAMLVKDRGAKMTLFGETEQDRTERKSFFRRLAEKKGCPAIDFEVVLCMEKE